MKRIKILDIENAKKNGIVPLSIGDDLIKLNLKNIPCELTIEEWINVLVKDGVLLVYETEMEETISNETQPKSPQTD